MAEQWHVFCRVVDNYGDAGVSWRLARQLVAEHGVAATLWIDRVATLARLDPGIDAAARAQTLHGVVVRPLADDAAMTQLPDVVIETFGCGLPQRYLDAMAHAPAPPLWINLEYLSAEPWVDTVHGLASPQPRLPLARHFWFPGFTSRTGGLIREAGLITARDAAAAGRRSRRDSPVEILLFCYANCALPALFDAWSEGDEPIRCTVPEGVATAALDQWLSGAVPHAGQSHTHGRLRVDIVPFVAQQAFDGLLWRSDVNFVRGEDSFVRAQWAARAFVWQPYPQDENAHRLKLDAFVARYAAEMPPAARSAFVAFSDAFNAEDGPAAAGAWPAFRAAIGELEAHGNRWSDALLELPELTAGLVRFARGRQL
ncbi:MAG TPA: elongation factor P maturation arginine rhamnosyltransferase EarP [Casimicrobiaceae bacterium]|nr:elongation factor P maturation arginine rhamnosyltransferase EarP [Casimicrobiaceae bacterium]